MTLRNHRRWAGNCTLIALGVTCQLWVVAIAAYQVLGCGPAAAPLPSCGNIYVSVHPGGCTDIEDQLATACSEDAWSALDWRFLAIDDHQSEFYTEGGQDPGEPAVHTQLCATQAARRDYVNETVTAHVAQSTPFPGDTGIAPVPLFVTVDSTRICGQNLCIVASVDQTGAPNEALLSVLVEPGPGLGLYDILWTANRPDPDSGINPGDATLPNLVVQLTGDTIYTVTVTAQNPDPFGDIVSVSDSVTAVFQGSGGGAPTAVDDFYDVDEDGVLTVPDPNTGLPPGVLDNDTDPEGDILTTATTPTPSHGTVALDANGSLVYTPDPNFYGTDTFDYVANDGSSDSNPATVTITVNAVNDAPSTAPDSYNVDEDTTLTTDATAGVLGNDTDVDDVHLNLTATLAPGADVTHGTLTLNPDGSFTYQPNPGYYGDDSFMYTASDGKVETAKVLVSIKVTSVNDVPLANAGADVSVRVGRVANLDGSLSSDPDAGPAPLTYEWTFVTLPPSAGSALTNASISGATTATPSFTPDVTGDFTLNLRVGDSADFASDQVTVHAGNTAPTAAPDPTYAIDEDQTLSVPPKGVLANDSDPESDPLTAQKTGEPSHGSVVLRADGSFDYTPDPNSNGTDTFTYKAYDGQLYSEDTLVSITVNRINDAPTAAPHTYTTPEDVTLDVAVAEGVLLYANDVDSDVLTAALVDNVTHGTLVPNPNALNPNGSFRYKPDKDFYGTDAFTYIATDPDGLSSAPVTVSITVTPIPDPPIANAGTEVHVRIGRVALLDGSLSYDPDGVAPPLGFAWTFGTPMPAGSPLTNADIAGAATATASFTPDRVGTYILNLEVSSGADTASAQVNVVAGNSAPSTGNDSYAVDEDGTLDVALPGVLANDGDPEGDAITAIATSGVSNGTLVYFNLDGSFRYKPAPDFNGTDSFTYVASDGDVSGGPATVTITVRPVNDPPTATADTYTVHEDVKLTVATGADGVLKNDTDVDASDVLTATLGEDVAHGTLALAANGSFDYTPDPNFNGTDTFTYTASDGTVSTDPATVTLTVDAVNDAPIANAGPDDPNGIVGIEIPLDGSASSDVDNDPLTYRWSFAEVPADSTAPIINPTAARASFVPDTSGHFVVQLIVNDGIIDSVADTASFDVTFCTDLTVNWVTHASGAWNVGANWSTGAVPGPTDDACIDVPESITVTHSTGTDSVRSLVSNEDFVLSGGSLELATPSVIHKLFTESGSGILTGAGDLRVRRLFTWAGGTQSGSGRTIGEGGMTLSGAPMSLSGRTIVNPVGKTASWAAGSFSFGLGGGFVNNGTFSTNFNGGSSFGLGGTRSAFTNFGTLEKTGGTGTSTLAFALDNKAGGIVRSSVGTLEFSGGGVSAGRFEGAATILFGLGTMEVNGICAVVGTSMIGSGALVNFNPSATVTNLGTLNVAGSGTVNFSTGKPVGASSLVQSAGFVTGPDTITVTGTMTWSGGEQAGPGRTEVGDGMTLTGAPMTIRGRTIVNAVGKTASWTAGSFNTGNGGGFVNDGTFSTNFNGAANSNLGGTRSVFTNSGTIEKVLRDPNDTPGKSTLGFALDNKATGIVRSSFGTLEFSGGGASAGRFEGAATILFSAGTMDLNGTYDVLGSTMIASSALVNFNPSATVANLGTLNVAASGTANFSTGKPVGASSLVQSGGFLAGPDTITVTGTMTWSGGEQTGPGRTEVGNGMTLTGAPMSLNGRTLVNAIGKTASWTAGSFNIGNGGGFENHGTFSTNFNGTSNFIFGGTRSVFTNSDTIEKTGGTGTSTFAFSLAGAGTATSSSGTLAFTGGGTNSVSFGGASTIAFAGSSAPMTLSGPITVANAVFSGGTTEVNGSYDVTGSSAFSGGAVANFNADATVNNVGALNIAASGTANFSSAGVGEVVSASSLVQSGGFLKGSDTIVVAGSMAWSGGEQTGPGRTEVGNGMTLTGAPMALSGRTLVNATGKTASWTAGSFSIGNGGGFENHGTFSTNFNGTSNFSLGGTRPVFTNSDTIEKTGGTGTSTFAFSLEGAGTATSSSGTLAFTGGGTNSVSFGGAATVAFAGPSTTMVISGPITAANTVFSGGTTEVNGSYNVTGSSAFSGGAIANFNTAATVNNVGALNIAASGTANFSSAGVGEVVSVSSLVQSGGFLKGSDTIVVAGSMTWSGGEQSGSGRTEVANGMTLTGTPMSLSGRTLVNAIGKTASWTAGSFNIGNGGGFENHGTFSTNFNGTSNFNLGGTRPVFTNSDTIEKTGGTGTSTFAFSLAGTGSATSSSGTLAFTGGGTNSVSFGGAATVGFAGSSTAMVISGPITAANTVFSAGTTEVNGVYDVSGSSAFSGSAVANFNTDATVNNVGALNIAASGTANFSSAGLGEVVNASSLVQSGGTLSGSDTIVVAGSMTWSGGEQSGSGRIEVGNGMTLTGSPMSLRGWTLVNAIGKTASWTAGSFNIGNGGGFENNGTFSTNFNGTANFNLGGTRPVFTNSGTIEKTAGTGTSTLAFVLSNAGTVRSSSGTLAFTGGYTQTAGTTALAGGALSATPPPLAIQGGSLVGSGSVAANVTNAGSVAPTFSGPLSVTGTYAQGTSGSLDIEISTRGTPGTDYDRLSVTGAATLGGALHVSLVDPFTPVAGDSFVVMSYSSAAGAFSSQSLPPLDPGLSWTVSVGPTALTLSVGP